MALLSSSGLTDTPSSSKVTGPSAFTQPYVSDVLGKGQAILNNPAPQYTGQLTAGTSDLQNQAFQGLSNLTLPSTMITAGTNLLDIGNKSTGTSYNPVGGAFDANAAQQYMNPYLQNALNPQLEEARRQSQITQLANNAKATQAGAYGGSRQALMDTETQRNLGTNLAAITGQGYNTAYDKAATQFNADQARRIQEAQYGTDVGLKGLSQAATANQAAGNVGAQQAQYGLQNLTALGAAGNTQQAQNQAGLNALYNQYLEQRNYPGTLLANQANLIKGIGGATSSEYMAKPSFLQSAVGTAASTAELIKNLKASGMTGDTITNVLKSAGINPSTLLNKNSISPDKVPFGYSLSPDGTYITDSQGGRYTPGANGELIPTGSTESPLYDPSTGYNPYETPPNENRFDTGGFEAEDTSYNE
jgi:hypothetical protein